MQATAPFTVDLNSVDRDDVSVVGGKAANLGDMANAGFPVPD